jgi:hypothetical protein
MGGHGFSGEDSQFPMVTEWAPRPELVAFATGVRAGSFGGSCLPAIGGTTEPAGKQRDAGRLSSLGMRLHLSPLPAVHESYGRAGDEISTRGRHPVPLPRRSYDRSRCGARIVKINRFYSA